MSKVPIFLFVLLVAGCSSRPTPHQVDVAPKATPEVDVCTKPAVDSESLSIVALLANPAKYEGRAVRVTGFYRSGFEHSAIYLHRDDAINFIAQNGLWVRDGVPDSIKGGYISVVGIFTSKLHGHLGQWPGTLCGVKEVTPWG